MVWNVGSAPMIGTPPGESVLLQAASQAAQAATAASSGGATKPDNVDVLLQYEESRRRLAAVRLPSAPWGPGSSLSPRHVQPPATVLAGWPAAATPAAADDLFGPFATPAPAEAPARAERSLIDL